MADRIYNVLFLCIGNSARSILAEAILNRLGAGRFRAFSAGSAPKGEVHPLTLRVLAASGFSTRNLRSKGWEEFAVSDAPKMDFVFTVCDKAAGESCPVWPGQPLTAHWGIADPSAVEGAEWEREAAFVAAMKYMRNRITPFINLPIESLDRLALASKLEEIGQAEDKAPARPDGFR